MARHRIGLSQAWQVREAEGDAPPCWSRSFGRPTGLEAADRVLLVVEGAGVAAELTLNGIRLGRPSGFQPRSEFDVTSLLRQRNELTLSPDGARPPPDGAGSEPSTRADRQSLWSALGDVSLEIVPAADATIA